jgi:cytochrome c-type biogenesis protein CcmE
MSKDPSDADGMSVPARRRRGEDDQDDSAPWKRRALVLGLGLAAASLAALVLFGVKGGSIYAKPVDQLLREKGTFTNRPVAAEGMLVHGSLEKRDQPCEYRFVIAKNGSELPVRFPQCVVPDTFRDVPGMDVGVTVEGRLQADDTFEATKVLAKCPSKYEMQEKQRRGEQVPHGPISQSTLP